MRKLLLIILVASFMLACSSNGSGSHEGGHHDSTGTKTATKDTTKKRIPSETKK